MPRVTATIGRLSLALVLPSIASAVNIVIVAAAGGDNRSTPDRPDDLIRAEFPYDEAWRREVEERAARVGLQVPANAIEAGAVGLAIEYAIGFDVCKNAYRSKIDLLPRLHRQWILAATARPLDPNAKSDKLRAAYYMACVNDLLHHVVEYGSDAAVIDRSIERTFDPATHLDGASPDAGRELHDMWDLYEQSTRVAVLGLGPAVAAPGLHRRVGTYGEYTAAFADLIAGNTLIEIKAKQVKAINSWLPTTARQLVKYVLLAPPTYPITAVSLYLARYGLLLVWPLTDFAERLAGHTVNLDELGSRLRSL